MLWPFLGLFEQPVHGHFEARHVLAVVAALDEGTGSHEVAQGLCQFGDPQILGGFEELPRDVFLRGQSMFETLQIDPMAAAGHGLHRDSIAARHIVQGVELLLQIPAPVPQCIHAVEGLRCSRRERTAAARGSAHRSGAPSGARWPCTSTYFLAKDSSPRPDSGGASALTCNAAPSMAVLSSKAFNSRSSLT